MRAALAAALAPGPDPGGGGCGAAARRRSATSPSRCTSPAPPGDPSRLFVVEQAGRVQVLVNGERAATPFLDLDASVDDAAASAGCSRSPSRRTTRRAGCSTSSTPRTTATLTVREGQRTRRPAPRRRSARTLFLADPAPARRTTTAASSRSAPTGGSTSAPATAAQRRPETTRRDLRACSARSCAIDPRAAAAPAIWALGLRNPWRFSFDRATGDHGHRRRRRRRAARRSTVAPPRRRQLRLEPLRGPRAWLPAAARSLPVLSMAHADGYCGVIGGFVVRDPGLPSLARPLPVRRPLEADAAVGGARRDTTPRAETTLPVSAPTSFGEDACGHVYVAPGDGAVSRVDEVAGCAVREQPRAAVRRRCAPARRVAPGAPRLRRCASARQRTQRRRRVKLRLTRRAGAMHRTLRAQRLPGARVVVRPAERRVVRIAPTRKGCTGCAMRCATAAGARCTIRIAHRATPPGNGPCSESGRASVNGEGGGATLLVAPPPLSESFRAPSVGSGP